MLRNILIFQLISFACLQVTTGRNHNMGAHFLLKRQPSYDYYDSPQGSYQNDDVCPSKMEGILTIGDRRCLLSYFFNDEIIMLPIHYPFCSQRDTTVAETVSLEVLQMYESEPPSMCPIIEAEIRLRPDITDIKCSLLWDYQRLLRYDFFPTLIHAVCRGLDKPDINADNNPSRIFSLIPQRPLSTIGYKDRTFFSYKICPGRNTTCDDIGIAVNDLVKFPDIRARTFESRMENFDFYI